MGGNGREAGDGEFTSWLRRRSDEELAALLAARMDLLTPAPAGIGALASRASRRLSLERALDDLDQFALWVVAALMALPPPVSVDRLREALGTGAAPIRARLAMLTARALAWRAGGGLWPAPGLRAVISEPRVPDRKEPVSPEPPPLDGIQNGSREVDQAAAGAALTAVRCTEELLTRWAAGPPPVLRSGGLGVRELRKAAASLDVDPATAAVYTEVARAAGLLAASSWTDGEWLPTHAFDTWLKSTPADRWAALVTAWLATTRVPALVGRRDERGRLLNALGTGLDRVDAPRVRALLLRELAAAALGTSATTPSLLRRLTWLWPRRMRGTQVMIAEAAVGEAALLGLTGMGALAAHGRAMVSAGATAAAAALAPILPEPIGHIMLQGDLTAVAPGPLVPELARELSLAADIESTGGATVYRFSAGSVRRALDAGRTGEDLLTMLEKRSRTPVPQPLRYVIEDLARRHGRIRVGAAAAYIRCDDPAVLAEIAADRRAAALRLRRLAPTVLTSSSRPGEVLAALRRLGYAPAAESADGTIEITGAVSRRAGDRSGSAIGIRPASLTAGREWTAGDRIETAVRVLRAGDEAAGLR
ncbi:MAG: helicase-associated domain-containing protein [Micromonosporaceae bacterium]